MHNIKLRVDDFPGGMPEERYNSKSKALLEYLEKEAIPYYLGVVPEAVSFIDTQYLSKLRYAFFCLHGFDHGFTRWRPNSEFDGMGEDEIKNRLIRAKKILSDLTIQPAFIPPFNMFNQALVNVLVENKYEVITGGPETLNQMDISKIDLKGLKLILSTGEFYSSNGNLKEMIGKIHRLPPNTQVAVHLNGNYEF